MSQMRTVTRLIGAKRGISITASPSAFLNESSHSTSTNNIIDNDTSALKEDVIIAGDYIRARLHHTQTISIPNTSSTTTLNPIQVPSSSNEIISQLRTSLTTSSSLKSLHILQTLHIDSFKWTQLSTLTAQEITLLIKQLSTAHDQAYKLRTQNKYARSAKSSSYKSDLSYQYLHTLRVFKNELVKQGFEFSIQDYVRFLNLEIQTLNLGNAASLISQIESLPYLEQQLKSSLPYQNLKLKVLGNTNPRNWQLSNTKHRMNRYVKQLGYTPQPMSSLIQSLSDNLIHFQPDLQTHKEIIGGFGRMGDLEQIKLHLNEIWGINVNQTEESDSKVAMGSVLYPDLELLQIIITSFGFNGSVGDALLILNRFLDKYDITNLKSPLFWRFLLKNIEINYKDDLKIYKQYFEMVWSQMQSNGVKFNQGLYGKRLTYLVQTGEYQQMIQDLPLLKTQYVKAATLLTAQEIQSLTTKYLNSIFYQLLRTDQDQVVIDSIITNYTYNEEHHNLVLKEVKKLSQLVKKEKSKFEELQRVYDEEDDENSIW